MLEWLLLENIALEKKQILVSRNKFEQDKLKTEQDRKERAGFPWQKD